MNCTVYCEIIKLDIKVEYLNYIFLFYECYDEARTIMIIWFHISETAISNVESTVIQKEIESNFFIFINKFVLLKYIS